MGEPTQTPAAVSIQCRKPTLDDAAGVHELVESCEALDVNSPYAYMLLCTHFSQSSVVAENEGEVVGFVSSYRKPADRSVLFIWQVAVSRRTRGLRVGSRMLDELFSREAIEGVKFLETTITPSNKASWALFESFAKRRGAMCAQQTMFRAEDFGANTHEEEQLLRIGPL